MENEEKIVRQLIEVYELLTKLREENPVLFQSEQLYHSIIKLNILKNIDGEYIMGKYK